MKYSSDIWNTDEFYETHYKLLKSQSFAKHIINKLGMVPKADLENSEKNNNKKSFVAFVKDSISEIIGFGGSKTASEEDVFDPIKESEDRKKLKIR